jgi:hypothetical protein
VTTVLVLVILGLIWAAVLLPPYLQNRREHRPGDSIASFRHQLAVIERATPEGRARSTTRLDPRFDAPRFAPTQTAYAPVRSQRPVSRAAGRPVSRATGPQADIRKRRKDVFLTLLGAVGVTFLLALVMGGSVWMLQGLTDVALVGYVGLLLHFQQVASERELKVRFIDANSGQPHLRSVPSEYQQPLLRRVGS